MHFPALLYTITVYLGVCPFVKTAPGGAILEKLTYTHGAAAAAVIASVYPDAPPMAYVHSFGCQQNVNDGDEADLL